MVRSASWPATEVRQGSPRPWDFPPGSLVSLPPNQALCLGQFFPEHLMARGTQGSPGTQRNGRFGYWSQGLHSAWKPGNYVRSLRQCGLPCLSHVVLGAPPTSAYLSILSRPSDVNDPMAPLCEASLKCIFINEYGKFSSVLHSLVSLHGWKALIRVDVAFTGSLIILAI